MPRVNRDLQRRMAARRERERRRPTERRYNFATQPELVDTDEDIDALESVDGATDDEVVTSAPTERAPASARARGVTKSFSSYSEEYAYVTADLRRVAAVIGGLLVALIVLYFALPILAR